MAEYPKASPMGLFPRSVEQPDIKPTIVIVHTYVGNPTLASNLAAMEPLAYTGEHHFYMRVGGNELAQYLSTTTRADNNLRANSFNVNGVKCGAISIETGDKFNSGDRELEKSWSDLGQFDPLVELVAWCCETHDIPVRRCPSPTAPGIGYHAMWGFNELGPGDGTYGHITDSKGRNIRLNNPWTPFVGKPCPGPGKTAEFPELLDEVARRIGVTPPASDDDDDDDIDAAMREVPWTGELRASAAVTLQGRAVQWRLTKLGFPPVGGVDGNYGTKSAAACRLFQSANGLPSTGVVDKATWRKLGLREPDHQQATTTVRAGEGWIAIARRTIGADRWRELRDLNGGPDRVLHAGDVIQLPA
jgi:hypothetical protein